MLRFNILAPTVCLLIFSSIIPHIFASSDSNSTEETGNYVNQSLGFSFSPPIGWTVQELKKTQPNAPDVAVVAAKVDGFAPVISVTIANSNGTSLGDHIKNEKAQLQPAVDAGRLSFLSDETKKINNYDVEILEVKSQFLSQNQGLVIKFKEAVISANDKFYTITYANQEKHFDDDLQIFDDVLNSFQTLSITSSEPSPNFTFEIVIGIAIAIGVIAVILTKKKKSLKKES